MPVMLPQELEKPLSQIEFQLSAVAEALGRGDPTTLEVTSATLRQTCADFARLIDGQRSAFSSPQSKQRLRKIVDSIAIQRESLVRRAAGVERTLGVLMPGAERASYAQSSGVYGGSVKSSGAFRQFSA